MKISLKLLFLLGFISLARLLSMENNQGVSSGTKNESAPAQVVFELTNQTLKLRLELLELHRQLLQQQSDTIKVFPSASELAHKSFEQDLAAYWEAYLKIGKTFDELSCAMSRWRRDLSGQARDTYAAFSSILPAKAANN